ncbi:MAG: hypothetical protein R3F46_15875 [bacterium]
MICEQILRGDFDSAGQSLRQLATDSELPPPLLSRLAEIATDSAELRMPGMLCYRLGMLLARHGRVDAALELASRLRIDKSQLPEYFSLLEDCFSKVSSGSTEQCDCGLELVRAYASISLYSMAASRLARLLASAPLSLHGRCLALRELGSLRIVPESAELHFLRLYSLARTGAELDWHDVIACITGLQGLVPDALLGSLARELALCSSRADCQADETTQLLALAAACELRQLDQVAAMHLLGVALSWHRLLHGSDEGFQFPWPALLEPQREDVLRPRRESVLAGMELRWSLERGARMPVGNPQEGSAAVLLGSLLQSVDEEDGMQALARDWVEAQGLQELPVLELPELLADAALELPPVQEDPAAALSPGVSYRSVEESIPAPRSEPEWNDLQEHPADEPLRRSGADALTEPAAEATPAAMQPELLPSRNNVNDCLVRLSDIDGFIAAALLHGEPPQLLGEIGTLPEGGAEPVLAQAAGEGGSGSRLDMRRVGFNMLLTDGEVLHVVRWVRRDNAPLRIYLLLGNPSANPVLLNLKLEQAELILAG